MAPTKRSRAALEEVSEEVVDVRHARSQMSQDTSSKRVRLSYSAQKKTANGHESSSSDSEDGADEDQNERGGRDSPPRTQYEIARDDGFRHLQYEDQDDQLATQKIASRPQRIGENHAAENGIIESVECINFMCHERLYVELGPLINFIVGENGSGKSAVLTALTLCLGGKASSTNRGGSLKSFIKEGRDNSVIIVRIKNQGIDAYQPDLYGDSIRVERHFSRAGASGFKLKSVTGKTISTKKADVDEISEYWALQVDNPLNVLSQDNARQFLNSSSPSMKYKFFVRGVQLEQLDNDYKLLTEILESHEAKLPVLEEHVRRAEREYSEARKLRDIAEKNEEMRKEYRRLRNQLYWSQVAEQEDILQQYNDQLESFDGAINGAEAAIEQKSEALARCDEQLAAAQTALQNKAQEETTIQDEVHAAEATYQEAKKAVTEIHQQLRDVQQRHKNAKQQVTEFESKIRAEEQRLDAGAGSARQEQERLLNEARSQEAEINQEIEQGEQKMRELKAAPEEARRAEAAGRVEFSKKREEVSAAESRLRNLQQNGGSVYAAYDRNIPMLLQAIERDAGFDEKPVGPLGAHIQLLQPAWSSILESVFGAVLDGFLVANKKDQQRLAGLMRRCNLSRTPTIIIGKRLPPNLTLREPDPKFDTILRVLKFDSDWVRSQLIVSHSIDKIILIPDRNRAQTVMMGNSPPPNVQVCLTFHDGANKRGHGIRIMAKESGASQSPVYPYTRDPRMKSDNETQVKLQTEVLAHLRGELRSLETGQRRLEQAAAKCNANLASQQQENEALRRKLRRVQSAIENIAADLDQYEGVDGRLISLREELEKCKAEKDHQGTQYGEMRLRQEELNKEVEKHKEVWAEEKRRHKDFGAHANKLQLAVQKAEDLRKLAVMDKNNAFAARDDAIEEKRRAEAKRDQQAETVANFTQQAMEKAPHRAYIPAGQTHKSIEAKYTAIHQQLEQRAQRLGASDEQIKERASRAEAAYESAKLLYEGQQEEQQAGKLNLEDRLNRWRLFQRHISARARICFQYLLSERGFRGKLAIDHPQKRLSLFVEPDETRKTGSGGRSTKTLSGGEKSFSSICMLLAIWEAMGSPLRCLDEFDVFMDNVNRMISTNMLINAARRSVSRQYIMITPNAIEGRATLDKDVKIIRLTDPRQRTLV